MAKAPVGYEFLLGDDPAIAIQYDDQSRATLFEGAIGDAHAVVMPISPNLLIGFGPEGRWIELASTTVDTHNAYKFRVHGKECFTDRAKPQQVVDASTFRRIRGRDGGWIQWK